MINPKVELASGEYDRQAAIVGKPSVIAIAKLMGVSPNALRNYRANYISRRKTTNRKVKLNGT